MDDDDDEDNSAMNNLVMPDAMPSGSFIPEPKRPVGRRSRGDRGEGMFSVPRTLEPLVEQRSLEADTGQQDFMHSSNSDEPLEMDSFVPVFPTAIDSPPVKLSRKTTDLSDSHQQGFDSLFGKPVQNSYGEFRGNFNSTDLKGQGRMRRQQAREEAKAEQKALLLHRREEQEKAKKLKSREPQRSLLKDYSTFSDSGRNASNGILVQQETKFDTNFKEADDSLSSPSLPVRGSAFPSLHIFPQELTRTSRAREDRNRNRSDLNDITRVTNQMTAL